MKRATPLELITIALAYIATHIAGLLIIPVFADEAIYIRWAQLIQDDAKRYAFFSMADGKPPLFMWALSFWLHLTSDPLLAGRLFAVLVGLLTVFVVRAILVELGAKRIALTASSIFMTVLPFWFFYHRMALMDGLLTLCLGLSFLFALRVSEHKKTWKNVLFLGLSFAGALWTKTPALFAIPIIALTPVLVAHHKKNQAVILTALGGAVGCALFLSLRISQLFGALFKRSGDFTFSLSQLAGGEWKYVLFSSLPRDIGWVAVSLTIPFVVLLFAGLFTPKRRQIVSLIIAGMVFGVPLVLLGRVLSVRYFLPCALWLTLAGSISVEELVKQKFSIRFVGVFLTAWAVMSASSFVIPSYVDASKIPFVKEDAVQYLNEWSAGYGTTEVRDFLVERSNALAGTPNARVIVLTEGSFGSLPDGLQIYFHSLTLPVPVEIEGIGVSVPVLPVQYTKRISQSTEVYYVANSHRIGLINQDNVKLVATYKRPNGPSLLLFKVLRP